MCNGAIHKWALFAGGSGPSTNGLWQGRPDARLPRHPRHRALHPARDRQSRKQGRDAGALQPLATGAFLRVLRCSELADDRLARRNATQVRHLLRHLLRGHCASLVPAALMHTGMLCRHCKHCADCAELGSKRGKSAVSALQQSLRFPACSARLQVFNQITEMWSVNQLAELVVREGKKFNLDVEVRCKPCMLAPAVCCCA